LAIVAEFSEELTASIVRVIKRWNTLKAEAAIISILQ
jgi:hypothetical protein